MQYRCPISELVQARPGKAIGKQQLISVKLPPPPSQGMEGLLVFAVLAAAGDSPLNHHGVNWAKLVHRIPYDLPVMEVVWNSN